MIVPGSVGVVVLWATASSASCGIPRLLCFTTIALVEAMAVAMVSRNLRHISASRVCYVELAQWMCLRLGKD